LTNYCGKRVKLFFFLSLWDCYLHRKTAAYKTGVKKVSQKYLHRKKNFMNSNKQKIGGLIENINLAVLSPH